MVIGYLKISFSEKFILIERFIPKINNWSVYDSFCSGLKVLSDDLETLCDFLENRFESSHEYETRFAMLLGMLNLITPKMAVS